jgi:hypothetical protein
VLEGIPTSLASAALILVAVIPGACFVWGFEAAYRRPRLVSEGRSIPARITGQRTPPGERILLFVLATVGYHLVLGWPEYLLWREHFSEPRSLSPGRFAVFWLAAVAAVALPGAAGWSVGRLWRQPLRDDDAWYYALATHAPCYVRVHTTAGKILGGFFGDLSVATFDPRGDLLIEQAFDVAPDGTLGQGCGYAAFVAGDQIRAVDFIQAVPVEDEE